MGLLCFALSCCFLVLLVSGAGRTRRVVSSCGVVHLSWLSVGGSGGPSPSHPTLSIYLWRIEEERGAKKKRREEENESRMETNRTVNIAVSSCRIIITSFSLFCCCAVVVVVGVEGVVVVACVVDLEEQGMECTCVV